MANIYVRSSDGDDSDDGSTWALAKATIQGAGAIDSPGDTIFVSSSHSQSAASALAVQIAGTPDSPVRILSVNDAAEPPTALLSRALFITTGASNITLTGAMYVRGVRFACGSGSSSAAININHTTGSTNWPMVFEDVEFRLISTNANNRVNVGLSSTTGAGLEVEFRDCTFRYAGSAQGLLLRQSATRIIGGGLEAGGTSPNNFVVAVGISDRNGCSLHMENVDLSAGDAGINIIGNVYCGADVVIRNIKLPSSWSGELVNGGVIHTGARAEAYNLDDGDTNYKFWIEDYHGSIRQETTLVMTGGATTGAQAYSQKMVTSANNAYPSSFLRGLEMPVWLPAGSHTVEVEILHDSATALKDDEIALEVCANTVSNSTLGTTVSDAKADVLASAADQASSSVTWTTTGMSNPNTQKLVVSVTTAEEGWVIARVVMWKPSYTVYVNGATLSSATQRIFNGAAVQFPAGGSSGGGMRLAGHGGLAS